MGKILFKAQKSITRPTAHKICESSSRIPTQVSPSKLEWAYGYQGKGCRANVYLLPTGEIVYFIASVVVLFKYEERIQQHYLGHTDCVKYLAVHPDKIRIATGQIAGVDKDGRVSVQFDAFCTW